MAFRLEGLGLRRRAADAGSCAGHVGLPDFPPGAALAALAPRLESPSPSALDDAFERRELVRVRAMRGAPVVIRPADYDVFVSGMLPRDESAMRAFLGPAMASVKASGLPALEAVGVVTDEATRALSKRPLDRDALHAELRKRLPKPLLPYCRACDSHHVHPSMLYAVALRGRFVLFPRDDGPYLVDLADRWLGARKPRARDAGEGAPAELVRRFLRAYGPATVADFATWAGIGSGQAKAMWSALEDELAPVEVDVPGEKRGAVRYVLAEDRKRLGAASAPDAVRLVSPGDPLLQMRDRAMLVPDAKLHKVIWKNLAPTGVVLSGTELVGLVRAKKKGTALQVAIEPVATLGPKVRAGIEEGAGRLAAVRGVKLTLALPGRRSS